MVVRRLIFGCGRGRAELVEGRDHVVSGLCLVLVVVLSGEACWVKRLGRG
jgi:hypothetical protein